MQNYICQYKSSFIYKSNKKQAYSREDVEKLKDKYSNLVVDK